MLTGDTLFVGDVGRPDLRVALGWSAADLGGLLYDSLRTKLLTLPDASLVYPAHGAGSLCGKALSKETVSTIGEQRRSNYALQPMTQGGVRRPGHGRSARRAGVLHLRRGAEQQGAADARRGAGARAQPDDARAACWRCSEVGAQILDTRDPAEFAAAHLAGSINIGLGGQYATWAGTMLSREQPIVIIADPGREHEAAMRLGRIGFDHVVGYSEGRPAQPRVAPGADGRRPSGSARRVAAERLRRRARAGRSTSARRGERRAEAHRRQRQHPAQSPRRAAGGAADAIARCSCYCAGGYRSSIAASLLQQPRVHAGQRDRRRHRRLGSRAASARPPARHGAALVRA